MRLIKSIQQELIKVFTSKSLYICIFITFILCFTSGISINNKTISIFTIFLTYDRENLLNDIQLSSLNIFTVGAGSWLSMFIPIVAAFPFFPLFNDERTGGGIRNSIIRQIKIRYNLSKSISAIFSGGCAVMLGYALFGIAVFFMFPSLSLYPQDQVNIVMEMYQIKDYFVLNGLYNLIGSSAVVIAYLIQMFIFGAISVLPALIISSVVKNKYLTMCIPFLIKYVWDQTILKLTIYTWTSPNKKLEWFTQAFNFNNTNSLFCMSKYFLSIILIDIVLIFLSIIIFNIFMNRRIDTGA